MHHGVYARIGAGIVAALLGTTSTAALAQGQDKGSATAPPSTDPAKTDAAPATPQDTAPNGQTAAQPLGDIIVTAQRRSENLQRVPIAVTAIGSAQLAKTQTLTTRDVQFSTPSLVYNQAANNAQPFLRGIGSDLFGPNLDASVATYVDGVYISSGHGLVASLLGVDRVEVLSGPQGTLFGRNAVGGAISIYTLTPGDTLDAKFSVTAGNYQRASISGYVSGPITDTLSVGVYAGYDYRKTFHDIPQNNAMFPFERKGGARVKAVWEPVTGLKLIGSAEYAKIDTTEMGALRNIQPNALGYLLGADPRIARNYYPSDLPQGTEIETKAYMLREEVGVGFADLVGITAYRDLHSTTVNDLDGTSAAVLADYARDYSQQFSQEVQLLSKSGSPVTWIIGGYYFHESTGYQPVSIFSPVAFAPAPFTALQTFPNVKTNSYAAFGQATAPLFGGLKLTLGGRYTRDEKTYNATDRFTTGTGMDGLGTEVLPAVIYPELKAAWNKFTPKVTLDFTSGRTLVYVTWSKGFKGGAFNVASPSAAGPASPETLTAYEGGLKTTFANGRVRLNAAAYYYDFKDLQVQLVGSNGQSQLQNAAAGHAYGIEGALTVVPFDGFTLNASASAEKTKYSDFPNLASYAIGPAGNPATQFNVTGNTIIRAPKFASNVSADYTHELADGGKINANVKWYYNGGYFWEPTNRFRQPAYSLVNLSLSYTLPGDHVTVTAFVSNLLDKEYQTSLLVLPVSTSVSDGEPRMYGLTLGWRL